jgi:hypothetical protein
VIHVDRSKTACPAVLTDATLKTGGVKETAKAIKFYAKKSNHRRSFPYKAYGHPEVRRALEVLFQGKCAYCEFRYGAVHPAEVEHWRPKGQVENVSGKKKAIKPGYYWLAATWDNLLPSCIDCNRRRYHEIPGSNGKFELLGKKDAFPLTPASVRARKPGQEKREKPLLLHPCRDDPARHLEFRDDAVDPAVIKSRTGGAPAKAIASINTYGLNRPGLLAARKDFYRAIRLQMTHVTEARARMKKASSATVRNRERQALDREMNALLAYAEPSAQFSQMARMMVGKFLNTK